MTTYSSQPAEAAAIDTYIDQGGATTNYGTDGVLLLGGFGTNPDRVLIKFDLSTIPSGANILSATLSLYMYEDASSNSRTVRVYRQKRAWTEAGATWNKYDASNNWSTAGGFHADDCEQTDIGSRTMGASETINQFYDWSLTTSAISEMVNGTFTNNGFLMKVDTESGDQYKYLSSGTATAGNRPKLVIEYTISKGAHVIIWDSE